MTKPLRDGVKLERDRFLEVATSGEGKAGMRFFFTQQRVTKLPRRAREGDARGRSDASGSTASTATWGTPIAFLARRAGFEVVGHVPVP